jgi:hypothetical protein
MYLAGSGGAAIQNLLEVLGRAVAQDKGFRADGLQRIELLFAFQNLLVAVEQFFARGNVDDIAVAALIQALGLQNQVQCLIPRHIFQAQVILPVTESLVTMLSPVNSAITCNTVRTSMFWKLSDSLSPLY